MDAQHITEAQLTAAPLPLRIEGKDYYASPLDDTDISELDLWIRGRFIASVRESLHGCTQEQYELDMRIAMREAQSLSWYSGLGAKTISTLDGMTRLVWQMLKKRHPDLPLTTVQKHLGTPQHLREAMGVFRQLNIDPFEQAGAQGASGAQGTVQPNGHQSNGSQQQLSKSGKRKKKRRNRGKS